MKHTFTIVWILLSFIAFQDLNAQAEILDEYIKIGLKSNLSVRNQKLEIGKSLEAQKESRRMFSPSLSLNARYTIARGGRVDVIPISEIFEDVPNLPAIPDQTVTFLREREHETKLSFILPIFEPKLIYNKKIIKEKTNIEIAALGQQQRKLVADIKSSYYQFLITIEVLRVLENTKALMDENLRITKSLVKNGKSTYSKISRVEAEMADLETRLIEAEKDSLLAGAYFNLLLNKPLTSEILTEEHSFTVSEEELTLEDATNLAKANREEFDQLKSGIKANEDFAKLNKWEYSPKLLLAADYGFQGVDYEFNNDQDFVIGSLVLKWTFFDGMAAKSRAAQTQIETSQLKNEYLSLQQLIELQVLQAFTEVQAAKKTIQSTDQKTKSAKDSYRFTQKQYEQNMVNHIELLDAQTTMTQAEIEQVIAHYNYLMALANYEYVSASYKLRP